MATEPKTPTGTYLLLARLEAEIEIAVGQLGRFPFRAGWYTYAGSALGPGGLEARLARHRRQEKRLHWHIDYLLQECEIARIWTIESEVRLECAWATAMACMPAASLPARGFGASDCGCRAHLAYWPDRPSDNRIVQALVSATRVALGQDQETEIVQMTADQDKGSLKAPS
jgi:Uri superfamily endonuclease